MRALRWLALSIVVGVSLCIWSFTRTFRVAFDEILRADLYVRTATWRPFGSDVPPSETRLVPSVSPFAGDRISGLAGMPPSTTNERAADAHCSCVSGSSPFAIDIGRYGMPVFSMRPVISGSACAYAAPLPRMINGFLAERSRSIAWMMR